ncbi:nucleotide-binding oligomerization domain-containing protein 1-like [Exaiptasia diaphana]|uniref:NACHT domain-containing protein n=1 Tax=Exaiptasia diaphana TaxID=2652724 RepID=A0A913YIK6_EXADI|nr:nucleotide-binding oligomerization domain-containing protein 1-like [Exaiptasia diaphana]
MDNPQSILFIFDGLDEYKHRENLIKDQSEFNGLNGLKDEMPITAIYAKLLQKKLLPGATILTTSRPNAVGTLKILNVQSVRVVEILGFTPEKVKSYIDRFCKDNATTASKIWLHIESNFNLLYLCYIPVNCWIICSLLYDFIAKHSSSLDSLVLPTTLTDIYKGALRLFLFKHSPKDQQQISISDYTNNTFSTTIEEVLSKLGKLAIKGMENEQLVFEEVEVQGLENCGFLNCMPNKTNPALGFAMASQYCFIHLTLQEFLAAREIAKTDDLNEVVQFINDKAEDHNWYLVIQFVAGLLKKHTFEVSMCFEDMLCHSLIQGNKDDLVLLILKCFYELSNEEAAERAARKLESCKEFSGSITFFDVAIPDCTAIVFVLRHCMTRLVSLSIEYSLDFGDYGCSELMKIFVCKVSDSHKQESSHLTQLDLSCNKITDQGVLHLSDALKSENCHLTQLDLHLSDALKSENCHLTKLDLSENQITDQGVLQLSDALKSENCHLTQLNLNYALKSEETVVQNLDYLEFNFIGIRAKKMN